ncbi:MAG: sulfatase/phosphatase domain-containing protein, partial [Bacteroidota bacterium]
AKVAAGSQSDIISGFQDMLPTFIALAQGKQPQPIDGISLLPTLTETGQQHEHNHLYWEFGERGGRVAVRRGRWKAIRYNVVSGEGDWELYDLHKDLAEQSDLASTYPDTLASLVSLAIASHMDSEKFPLPVATLAKRFPN